MSSWGSRTALELPWSFSCPLCCGGAGTEGGQLCVEVLGQGRAPLRLGALSFLAVREAGTAPAWRRALCFVFGNGTGAGSCLEPDPALPCGAPACVGGPRAAPREVLTLPKAFPAAFLFPGALGPGVPV